MAAIVFDKIFMVTFTVNKTENFVALSHQDLSQPLPFQFIPQLYDFLS
jgi:hypothetical protein